MANRTKRKVFDWAAWSSELTAFRRDTLDSAGAYLAGYFGQSLPEPDTAEGGYTRRPVLGLRLRPDDTQTLAIRPHWTPPHSGNLRDGNGEAVWEGVLGDASRRKYIYVDHPGKLDTEVICIELLDKKQRLLGLTLSANAPPKPTYVRWDMDINRQSIRTITDLLHGLLIEPEATFAQSAQSNHCCCCGRGLTDVVSRTRGIGPECIKSKSYGYFSLPPISAVEKYRLDHRDDELTERESALLAVSR